MNSRTKIISGLFILALLVVSFFSGEWSKWLQAIVLVFAFLLAFLTIRTWAPSSDSWSLRKIILSPHVYLVLWLGLASASIGWSVDWYDSLTATSLLMAYALVWWAAYRFFRTADTVRALAYGVAGTGVVASVAGFILYINQTADRLSGFLFNANAISSLLILTVPVTCVMAAQQTRKKYRWLVGIASVIIIAALALTYSFTAWVSVMPSVLIGLYYFRRSIFTRRRVMIAAGIVLIGIIGMIGFRYAQSRDMQSAIRVYQAISSSELNRSFSQRINFNLSAIEIFRDHPLVGTGINTFQSVYSQYARTILEQPRYAHNYYIQTAAELGIIGMVALLGFLLMAGRQVLHVVRATPDPRHRHILVGLSLGVLASALNAVFDFGWQFPGVFLMFWVMAGALAGQYAGHGREGQLEHGAATLPRRALLINALYLVFGLAVLLRGLSVFMGVNAFDTAAIHVTRDEIPEAAAAYEQGLRYDPDPTMLAQYSGLVIQHRTELEAVQFDGLLPRVEAMVRRSPDDYLARWTYGRVLYSLKRYDEAITEYTQAIALNPKFRPDLYYDLAYTYFITDQPALAKQTIAHILVEYGPTTLTRNPNLPDQLASLHYLLGELYRTEGNAEAARERYEMALELNRWYTPAYAGLDALYQEGS